MWPKSKGFEDQLRCFGLFAKLEGRWSIAKSTRNIISMLMAALKLCKSFRMNFQTICDKNSDLFVDFPSFSIGSYRPGFGTISGRVVTGAKHRGR